MKRAFGCEDAAPSIPSPGNEGSYAKPFDYPYEKLKHARFPAKVEALPDILADINEWAKSPEEATVDAVLSSQQDRFEYLKSRFGYEGLGKAMAFAAEAGLLGVVKFIIAHGGEHHESDDAESSAEEEADVCLSWESKRDAAVAAAGTDHLDIVEFLFSKIILSEYDSDDEDEDRMIKRRYTKETGMF